MDVTGRPYVMQFRRPKGCISISELARALGEPYWKVWIRLRDLRVPYRKEFGVVWIRIEDAKYFAQLVFRKEVNVGWLSSQSSSSRN